jgi:hypothetical protein
LLRRCGVLLLAAACVAGIVGFQVTRPAIGAQKAHPFVPAPRFFEEFSPTYRTSIADVYWLGVVQYYGQHVTSDGRLDSLKAMLDVITTLSPGFVEPYFFGAFALTDAGQVQAGYDLLRRGFAAHPRDWRFPARLGFFAYRYGGNGTQKDVTASQWYQKAAQLPGRPEYIPRFAAILLTKGGDKQKAILLWAQVYGEGDKYTRQKAVAAIDDLLPKEKQARMKAIAPTSAMMTPVEFEQFLADVFKGYY